VPEQNDFQHSVHPPLHDRRASVQDNNSKLLAEIHATVTTINSRMDSMSDAFVKDDLGKPDYHGHRKAHLEMMKAATAVEGIKLDMTKKVLGVMLMFVLGLVAAGFIDYLKDHIK
jgi:hypothetical protein